MKKAVFFLSFLFLALACEGQDIALPSIPDRSVSLAQFGGVGDGVTLNTDAFARAIEDRKSVV